MFGVQEPEQQAHRHGVGIRFPQHVDDALDLPVLQRNDHAVRAHALPHREPKLSRDELRWTIPGQVVERGPVLAPDLDDVAEAIRGDERGPRATAFEERVRGDRRAVREVLDVGAEEAGPFQRPDHALGLVAGSGRDLGRYHAIPHDGDEIGEGAADVDAQADRRLAGHRCGDEEVARGRIELPTPRFSAACSAN